MFTWLMVVVWLSVFVDLCLVFVFARCVSSCLYFDCVCWCKLLVLGVVCLFCVSLT